MKFIIILIGFFLSIIFSKSLHKTNNYDVELKNSEKNKNMDKSISKPIDVIDNNSKNLNKRNGCNISEINVSYLDSGSSPVLVFKSRVENKDIKFTVLSKEIHGNYKVKNTIEYKDESNKNKSKLNNMVWLLHKHDEENELEDENDDNSESHNHINEGKHLNGHLKKYRDAFTYCRKLGEELFDKYQNEKDLLNAHKSIVINDKYNHFSKRNILL